MDESLAMENLAARVARLERENRRLKRVGTLGLFLAVVLAAGGAHLADEVKTIEAERIILRERNGTARIELAVRPDGSAGLGVNDREGRKRFGLTVLPDGITGLGFRDQDGEQLIELSNSLIAGPVLSIRDHDGKNQVGLGVLPDGQTGLSIQNEGDDKRIALVTTSDGTARLDLRGKEQKGRVWIGSKVGELPKLLMWDADRRPILQFPQSPPIPGPGGNPNRTRTSFGG